MADKRQQPKQYNPTSDYPEAQLPYNEDSQTNQMNISSTSNDELDQQYYEEDMKQRQRIDDQKKKDHQYRIRILGVIFVIWFVLQMLITGDEGQQKKEKNVGETISINQQTFQVPQQYRQVNQQNQQVYIKEQQEIIENYQSSFLEKSQNYVESKFQLRGEEYNVWKTTRKSVRNLDQNLIPQIQYLRPTQTQVWRFKQPSTQQSHKYRPIKFQKIKSQKQFQQFFTKNYNITISQIKNTSLEKSPHQYMQFFNEIRKDPNNQTLIEAEYYLYDTIYNISHIPIGKRQKDLCIISVGRQTFSHNMQEKYLQSLSRQNYSSFKVIYVDDASDDLSVQALYSKIAKKYQILQDKMILLKNAEEINAFANKDSAIKQNCNPNDIVVEIDADDALIGRQALQVINSLYQQKDEKWVVYSNFLLTKSDNSQVMGISRKLKVKTDEYRLEGVYWATSHLKTYYAWLQMKIPINYLLNQGNQYPIYASDLSIMFSVIQLAGDSHVFFVKQLLYEYHKYTMSNSCSRVMQKLDGAKSRAKLPLKMLPGKTAIGEISQETAKKVEKIENIKYNISLIEEKVEKCLKKNRRINTKKNV